MNEIIIETKFNIGDIVYGFPDKELSQLKIDRIETDIEQFSWNSKTEIRTNVKITYLATTTDKKCNLQHRFKEEQLFTEESLKDYIIKFFDKVQMPE